MKDDFREEDLRFLNPREAHIIRILYGLPYRPSTLQEISLIFGRTRERIRQIEFLAMRKLKRAMKKMKIGYTDSEILEHNISHMAKRFRPEKRQ